jgi:hypothetical protein
LLPYLYKQFSEPIKKREEISVLVSLTSFPARIDMVWKTIFSILMQDRRPDKIILWLYKGEFNGVESLPKKLKILQNYGLQIEFCEFNLKPHKKYYYALKAFPDMHLVTIDDDTLYPSDFISNIIEAKRQYPNCIISAVCRQIKMGTDGSPLPYKEWNYVKGDFGPSASLLPIGVGGPMYFPGCFAKEVTNMEALLNIAPTTDDLWLRAMSLKQGIKVYCNANKYARFFVPIPHRKATRLTDLNVKSGVNDQVIGLLRNEYKVFI